MSLTLLLPSLSSYKSIRFSTNSSTNSRNNPDYLSDHVYLFSPDIILSLFTAIFKYSSKEYLEEQESIYQKNKDTIFLISNKSSLKLLPIKCLELYQSLLVCMKNDVMNVLLNQDSSFIRQCSSVESEYKEMVIEKESIKNEEYKSLIDIQELNKYVPVVELKEMAKKEMNTNETSNSLSLSKESIKSMLKEEKKEEVKLSKRVNSRRRKVVHTSVIDFEPDDEEEKKEEDSLELRAA